MEKILYKSTVCRLCGEENDNGILLYTSEENIQNLSEIINTYLPIKIADDGQMPRTICPGCTIQLEATVEFLNLIIKGQKILKELHQREKKYKKTVLIQPAYDEDVVIENIVSEADTSSGVYQMEHPVTLKMAGLDRPKRKRGRPPKKHKSPEELAQEAAARELQLKKKSKVETHELSGKRMRKTPTRFKEVVQGKELEKIFLEEGMTDGEKSEAEDNLIAKAENTTNSKEPEVIGHKEDSGELVVIVKGKGRGRPKGRMRLRREKCVICGMEFSSLGRYMSHVALHGPVTYQCGECSEIFETLLLFKTHQEEMLHTGQNIITGDKPLDPSDTDYNDEPDPTNTMTEAEIAEKIENDEEPNGSLPHLLDPQPVEIAPVNPEVAHAEEDAQQSIDIIPITIAKKVESNEPNDILKSLMAEEPDENTVKNTEKMKKKMKCNYCDKQFSSKQSKSLHIRATHFGEKPYTCKECDARFGYPRSLALHKLSHRRIRQPTPRYACDLCGKVLNHPSSVVYHKEAEHAGQRYVCLKCGKPFKHKQLLQRHQLVHSQLRPYNCAICKASFKTKANLLNHHLLHSGVKKFTCEICNQKFAHKTSLTLHIRWHTGQKPYKCYICDKSFSQKGNLSEHERIHTGEKPYSCSLCSRRFTTSSQYRLHVRRHFTEQPHACNTCPKRFITRAARVAHERREAGWREHRCNECGRAFPERWSLLKHMRRHTGERPFRCPHCPRTFADCSNLNKHKKQVHKQMSLLASDDGAPEFTLQPHSEEQLVVVEPEEEGSGEGVVYVAYEVNNVASPTFHIIEPDQSSNIEENKLTTACSLYTGESLLMRERLSPSLQQTPQSPDDHNMCDRPSVIVNSSEHVAVADEQGNLYFTMPDGTRLAITSSDGKTLQVITEDGQTIPVQINEYSDEEDVGIPDTVVPHLNVQRTAQTSVLSSTSELYTIV